MGSFTPSTVPGCRLPHAWLADGRSLYDALGPDYTLVRFDPACDVAPLETAGRSTGLPLAVADVTIADAGERYDYPLLLVRPDHHIAWRGESVPADCSEMIARLRGARRSGKISSTRQSAQQPA